VRVGGSWPCVDNDCLAIRPSPVADTFASTDLVFPERAVALLVLLAFELMMSRSWPRRAGVVSQFLVALDHRSGMALAELVPLLLDGRVRGEDLELSPLRARWGCDDFGRHAQRKLGSGRRRKLDELRRVQRSVHLREHRLIIVSLGA
jgi:hypothetical protein